jgi:lipopolysaccharide transport system permease protein
MTTPASEGMSLSANPTFPLKSREIPDTPLVVVQPTSSWSVFDFQELWAHRELLYFLTWRDLKVRYKQTIFGVTWAIFQPVLMTLIFTVFLGYLVRVPTGGIPYPLLVYTGLLPWTFFSTSVLAAAQSLVNNSTLITKIYFPKVLIPAATIAGKLVDFFISFSILVGLMLFYSFARGYSIPLTWRLGLLPLIVILLLLLTLAVSILLSCLNVQYRDIGIALPVIIQLWMFVSPIVYSETVVPERWRGLYSLNPLVGLIQGFRAVLFGTAIPWSPLFITIMVTIVLLIGACLVFRRTEKTFADIV